MGTSILQGARLGRLSFDSGAFANCGELLSTDMKWTIEECIAGGELRAAFWRSQDWANLERARYAHWVLRRRHWPEEPYLHEFMADLSPDARAPRVARRKRPRQNLPGNLP